MTKEKKDAYYFSHDSNARNDIKILRLRRSLGLEGYGIYFCLIEMLREQDDYKMNMASIPDIAFELHASDEKVKAVICAFDLFVIDNEHFFSARLVRSMSEYKTLKTKLSEAGRKGGLSKAKAELKPSQSDPLALKEIKEKEIKEKEIKEKENKELSVDDLKNKYLPNKNFGIELYTNETAEAKFFNEEIQRAARRVLTKDDFIDFNSQLKINDKVHKSLREYVNHMRNWITTRPEQKAKEEVQVDKYGKPRPSNQYILLDGKWTVL
jgi:hypothetical protein